jgi:predicted RNA-binding protein with RPS1 domain
MYMDKYMIKVVSMTDEKGNKGVDLKKEKEREEILKTKEEEKLKIKEEFKKEEEELIKQNEEDKYMIKVVSMT